MVVGRLVGLGDVPGLRQPVIRELSRPPKVDALIVAARNWNKALARNPDRFSPDNDVPLQLLLMAAETLDT